MGTLTDNSKMPYGQHKGRAMVCVPAKDLLWLYENNKAFQGVKEYVEENKDVLKSQVKRKK